MCIDLYTSELFAVEVGFSVECDRDDIFVSPVSDIFFVLVWGIGMEVLLVESFVCVDEPFFFASDKAVIIEFEDARLGVEFTFSEFLQEAVDRFDVIVVFVKVYFSERGFHDIKVGEVNAEQVGAQGVDVVCVGEFRVVVLVEPLRGDFFINTGLTHEGSSTCRDGVRVVTANEQAGVVRLPLVDEVFFSYTVFVGCDLVFDRVPVRVSLLTLTFVELKHEFAVQNGIIVTEDEFHIADGGNVIVTEELLQSFVDSVFADAFGVAFEDDEYLWIASWELDNISDEANKILCFSRFSSEVVEYVFQVIHSADVTFCVGDIFEGEFEGFIVHVVGCGVVFELVVGLTGHRSVTPVSIIRNPFFKDTPSDGLPVFVDRLIFVCF